MPTPTSRPASTAIAKMIDFDCEIVIGDGERMVDLLQGAQPYKLEWSDDIRRSITLRYYNRSVRTVALKLLESGKQAAKILLR